ncbi:MAG: squalene--hopene cyclase [Chloroflexota bacterium]
MIPELTEVLTRTPAYPEIETSLQTQTAVATAIRRTQNYLLRAQHPDGYWVGKLEADASVPAGYIPLMHFMYGKIDPLRRDKVVNKVRRLQNADGSWSAFHAGPGDLSVSIQVYFALKLGGISADQPFMQRARAFILAQGGIDEANVITQVWLALFGQFDWEATPSIPPEIILLPNWFYFNIYELASWSRATIMALAVILTCKPVVPVPASAGLAELYVQPGQRQTRPALRSDSPGWGRFFLFVDHLFKVWERLPFQPGRERALRRVEQWILDHQEADGGWGGIMLPWIYSLVALRGLGYTQDHPAIARGMAGIQDFILEDETTLTLQPAVSPVWDTAWATVALGESFALGESGLSPEHPALRQAARWLLSQEIQHAGDWRIKNPHTPPGCWAFEFINQWYPDLDDTSLVPRALRLARLSERAEAGKAAAIQRALRWILDMQSKDGGWAAFDRDNNKSLLTHVPFADFISPLDPTCADVTAHVLELLSDLQPGNPAVERGIAYLQATQEPDGAWYGRWGVNYLYGTSMALAGLAAVGLLPEQECMRRGAAWLLSRQNQDGGWGETCQTYADPSRRGRGPSTASQTAWALIGLIAAGQAGHPAAARGIQYLLDTQQAGGDWSEVLFTGTGFPRVFYLHYDLYRVYFPLLALTRYQSNFENIGSFVERSMQ